MPYISLQERYPDAPRNVLETLQAMEMYWRFERLLDFAGERIDRLTEAQIELAILYLETRKET